MSEQEKLGLSHSEPLQRRQALTHRDCTARQGRNLQPAAFYFVDTIKHAQLGRTKAQVEYQKARF